MNRNTVKARLERHGEEHFERSSDYGTGPEVYFRVLIWENKEAGGGQLTGEGVTRESTERGQHHTSSCATSLLMRRRSDNLICYSHDSFIDSSPLQCSAEIELPVWCR
jgi:hypothetical protein